VPQELHNAAPLIILPNTAVLEEVNSLYSAMVQAVPVPNNPSGPEPEELEQNPVITALQWLTPAPVPGPEPAAAPSQAELFPATTTIIRRTSSNEQQQQQLVSGAALKPAKSTDCSSTIATNRNVVKACCLVAEGDLYHWRSSRRVEAWREHFKLFCSDVQFILEYQQPALAALADAAGSAEAVTAAEGCREWELHSAALSGMLGFLSNN
jgi:hypothetical protein